MRSAPLSLFALFAASGCAGARWSVVDARALVAVAVAPVELAGAVDEPLVAERRATLIGALRAHGYQVLDGAAPGVPTVTLKVAGTLVRDAQFHAPDDPRHNIYNDLHYQFVAYDVHLDVVDGGGRVVACGRARADADPAGAFDELTARLVRDLPASGATYAAR